MTTHLFKGIVAFACYIAAIVGANWLLLSHPEPIPVLPAGLAYAPSGVVLAGAVFTFRNLTQVTLGRAFGFVAIGIGALISAFVFNANVKLTSDSVLPLAAASGLSFALSELVDAGVWTWLHEHKGWWSRAMLFGDLAGQVIDSGIFLFFAFGMPGVAGFLIGQIIGKSYTVYPAVLLMRKFRPRRRRVYVTVGGGHFTLQREVLRSPAGQPSKS